MTSGPKPQNQVKRVDLNHGSYSERHMKVDPNVKYS